MTGGTKENTEPLRIIALSRDSNSGAVEYEAEMLTTLSQSNLTSSFQSHKLSNV